jgi:hypothetical protein
MVFFDVKIVSGGKTAKNHRKTALGGEIASKNGRK